MPRSAAKKCGGIATRSTAYDCNFNVGIVRHLFSLSLYRKKEWLLKSFGDPAQESGCIRAVDQPVIIRKR